MNSYGIRNCSSNTTKSPGLSLLKRADSSSIRVALLDRQIVSVIMDVTLLVCSTNNVTVQLPLVGGVPSDLT